MVVNLLMHIYASLGLNELTHWGRDKMDAISQTIFSNAFSSMKMFQLRLNFHWSLFPMVQLTILQHWRRPGDKPLSEPMNHPTQIAIWIHWGGGGGGGGGYFISFVQVPQISMQLQISHFRGNKQLHEIPSNSIELLGKLKVTSGIAMEAQISKKKKRKSMKFCPTSIFLMWMTSMVLCNIPWNSIELLFPDCDDQLAYLSYSNFLLQCRSTNM